MANRPTTHLGNKEMHKRHRIEIEPGPVPRARIRDQTAIDRFLDDKLITTTQHHAGEYFLRQASQAGVWAKGMNWDVKGGGKARPDYTPKGVEGYGNTLKSVRKRYGEFHAYVLSEVILYDWDISHSEDRMKVLREALDWVADHRMGHRNDPVRGLQSLVIGHTGLPSGQT